MSKSLIWAIYLSQSPISDVRVFHEQPTIVEYLNYELNLNTRRVHSFHVRRIADSAVVVSEDRWFTPKAPIAYAQFWTCPLKQTAQQCIAIESFIQIELPGRSMFENKFMFPDPLGK